MRRYLITLIGLAALIAVIACAYSGGELLVDNNGRPISALGPAFAPETCQLTTSAKVCGPYEVGTVYEISPDLIAYIRLGGADVTDVQTEPHYILGPGQTVRVKIEAGYEYLGQKTTTAGGGYTAVTALR